MIKTAVVLLNWNGRKFLEKFLPFVIQYSREDAEIIIADNNSFDDSLAFMQANYPEIRIIKNNENGGFSKGYNDALVQVEAEYYVLLNSDIEVTENWIKPIIALMDSDKNIAVCQPKLRSYLEREKFEYAGAAGGFIDKYGYPFCRGRLFQSLEIDKGQYDDVCEIFWATGAAMFVRAELYHKYGGLDNDFFAHMEEIDFCWRLKNEGYKIMYCPDSLVFHVGGGTLPKNNARKTYLNFRNNFYLLFKNLPADRLMKVFIFRLFLDFIAATKFLTEGGFKDFWAVIRAHFSFYASINKNFKKRKSIHQKKVSKTYMHNVVFEHYLLKKKLFTELKKENFS
ncbi:MAG: glycosyltransferase family 2 protein [Bacteroidetes bacterium]|nr:glycosyltransferase family 2 protein [Bacteroidota bacterium]